MYTTFTTIVLFKIWHKFRRQNPVDLQFYFFHPNGKFTLKLLFLYPRIKTSSPVTVEAYFRVKDSFQVWITGDNVRHYMIIMTLDLSILSIKSQYVSTSQPSKSSSQNWLSIKHDSTACMLHCRPHSSFQYHLLPPLKCCFSCAYIIHQLPRLFQRILAPCRSGSILLWCSLYMGYTLGMWKSIL